jgi:dephospho-CoA kinase
MGWGEKARVAQHTATKPRISVGLSSIKQRIIGITGGIACGKTTVANYLSDRYGLPILDADLYAREALTPENLQLIGDRYGQTVLHPDGSLNRRRLAEIIFADAKEKKWLESLIHPYVRDRLVQGIRDHFPAPVVAVVPLLFEANMTDLVTEIWLINCPQEIQLERLLHRDKLSLREAKQRIASQQPPSLKIPLVQHLIDSAVPLGELYRQVDRALLQT